MSELPEFIESAGGELPLPERRGVRTERSHAEVAHDAIYRVHHGIDPRLLKIVVERRRERLKAHLPGILNEPPESTDV